MREDMLSENIEAKKVYALANASQYSTLAMYKLLLHMRTDDAWMDVVRLQRPLHTVFDQAIANAEWCVQCILEADRRHSWLIAGLTAAAVVCGGILCVAIGISISVMQMGEVAQRVLFNLNHEMKGIVNSIIVIMDELSDTKATLNRRSV